MKTVFAPKSQPVEANDQLFNPATTPWHIVIDMKYTDREAAVIQAFISSLLDADSSEVIEQQDLGP